MVAIRLGPQIRMRPISQNRRPISPRGAMCNQFKRNSRNANLLLALGQFAPDFLGRRTSKYESVEGDRGFYSQGVAYFDELNNVDSALATFNLGHKCLCVAQRRCEGDLRNPGSLPQVTEEAQQFLIFGMMS